MGCFTHLLNSFSGELMQNFIQSRLNIMILVLVGIMVLAACGGSSSSQPTEVPIPTIIPTYNFVQRTDVPQLATVVAATASPAASAAASTAASPAGLSTGTLDPDKAAKGKDRYTALGCNACHGDTGEGTD